MSSIGKFFIEIGSKFDSRALDKAGNKLTGFRGGLAKLKVGLKQVAIAGGVMGAALGAGMAFAIKKASDLEETQSKFNTVFKQFSAIAEKTSKDLQRNYAMSEIAAKKNLSAIQDLLVPMGLAREEATKFSGEIVKLSADIGSFNNQPTEKVMLDIQSALVGNFETMKKYGVVVNATRVEQEAMNMGLATSKKAITQADKAMATYSLIMKGSSDAQGDMARTSESFANQMKFLNASVEDAVTNLGKGLLPIASSLIKSLNDDLIPAIIKWTESEENLNKIASTTDTLLRALFITVQGIITAFDVAATAVASFGLAITGNFKAAKAGVDDMKRKLENLGKTIFKLSHKQVEITKGTERIKRQEHKKTQTELLASVIATSNEVNDILFKNLNIQAEQQKLMREKRVETAEKMKADITKIENDMVDIIVNNYNDLSDFLSAFATYVINEVIRQIAAEMVIAMGIAAALKVALNAITGGISGLFGFAKGGEVPGVAGSPQMVMAHAGEIIAPPEDFKQVVQGMGITNNDSSNMTFNITMHGSDRKYADEISQRIYNRVKRNRRGV